MAKCEHTNTYRANGCGCLYCKDCGMLIRSCGINYPSIDKYSIPYIPSFPNIPLTLYFFRDPNSGIGCETWKIVVAATEKEAKELLYKWLKSDQGQSEFSYWKDGKPWTQSDKWDIKPEWIKENGGYWIVPEAEWELVEQYKLPNKSSVIEKSFEFIW